MGFIDGVTNSVVKPGLHGIPGSSEESPRKRAAIADMTEAARAEMPRKECPVLGKSWQLSRPK
eukprot:6217892-Lingulodinium_polyedra.AAC.1